MRDNINAIRIRNLSAKPQLEKALKCLLAIKSSHFNINLKFYVELNTCAGQTGGICVFVVRHCIKQVVNDEANMISRLIESYIYMLFPVGTEIVVPGLTFELM